MKKQMGTFLKELSTIISMAGKAKTIFNKMRYGNYLVTVLILVKCCYLLNAFGQIVMLNYFLKTKYTMYGIDILERSVFYVLPSMMLM